MNESFSFHGFSSNNQFFCMINGDDIVQLDYMSGQQKIIGKTAAAYNELEQTTTEYYNKLVELGVITPPIDPQQAMEDMQKTMQSMAELIKNLSDEVRELKQNERITNPISSEQNVSGRKPERNRPASAANDAGDSRHA